MNLTGANNAVDTTALGIANTSVAGGGTSLTNNTVLLSDTATSFLAGSSTQDLTFNIGTQTGNVAVTATISGADAGGTSLTGQQVVTALTTLNSKLNSYGISAAIGTIGQLQLSGAAALSVVAAAASGGNAVVTGTGTYGTTSHAINQGDYNTSSAAGTAVAFADFTGAATETAVFQNASGSTSVTLDATNAATIGQAISTLNTKLSGTGIFAVQAPNGTDISFQSASSFNVNETAYTADTGGALFGGNRRSCGDRAHCCRFRHRECNFRALAPFDRNQQSGSDPGHRRRGRKQTQLRD